MIDALMVIDREGREWTRERLVEYVKDFVGDCPAFPISADNVKCCCVTKNGNLEIVDRFGETFLPIDRDKFIVVINGKYRDEMGRIEIKPGEEDVLES